MKFKRKISSKAARKVDEQGFLDQALSVALCGPRRTLNLTSTRFARDLLRIIFSRVYVLFANYWRESVRAGRCFGETKSTERGVRAATCSFTDPIPICCTIMIISIWNERPPVLRVLASTLPRLFTCIGMRLLCCRVKEVHVAIPCRLSPSKRPQHVEQALEQSWQPRVHEE